jgi:hypothetical protein
LVQRIDGGRARGGAYADRLANLDARLRALERPLGLPGASGIPGYGFGVWLAHANQLGHRARAVLLARAERAAPPSKVPAQGLFVHAREDPAKPPPAPLPPSGPSADKGYSWPERLTFKATAKLNYAESGEWLFGPKKHSSWGPDFLQTGYEGSISVSIRARDLPREVRSADLRLVVRLLDPFAPAGGYRVIDLTWKSERTLTNQALKTWLALDKLTIAGPYRWIDEPEDRKASLDVEAHVRSVTLHDGTTFHFPAPEFTPQGG